jgi:hypothetical protein
MAYMSEVEKGMRCKTEGDALALAKHYLLNPFASEAALSEVFAKIEGDLGYTRFQVYQLVLNGKLPESYKNAMGVA